MGKKLLAIGEALIDMIPDKKGCEFAQITSFEPNLGGAPANVCGAFAACGGESELITMLGDDPFGHRISDELGRYGIGTKCISFTDRAKTCLAFVSLAANGNRTFSFYRDPSADMLFEASSVNKEWFDGAFALHFGSVALCESPMKYAHIRAIEYARAAGAIISFDPNLRFPLWPDRKALSDTVNDFIPRCDILKVSDEEIKFIAGTDDIDRALPGFFASGVRLVLYTKGRNGSYAFTPSAGAHAGAGDVPVLDTTGAGDGFDGSFLYSLAADGVRAEDLASLTAAKLGEYLEFSSRFCDLSVQKKGAIPSYPKIHK